jgi:ankyrin repeat protein
VKSQLIAIVAAVLVVGCGNPDGALIQAASDGNIEAVKQHLAAGADVNAKVKFGWAPLHIATMFGHKEIAELLISSGADMNAKDNNDGWIPLHYAAQKGHKEIAELLISKGADVNAKNKNGHTPLDTTQETYSFDSPEVKAARKEITDLLRKHGGKVGAELPSLSLLEVVRRGDLQRVKDFLANGADVNAKRGDFTTPLHLAAQGGHKEIAELLIANGVDVNAKKAGQTPLDLAIQFKEPETADLLRKHGGKTGAELKAEGK